MSGPTASLALGLVGAVIGNFIAPGIGGSIGFAVGSAAGGALFPGKLPKNVGPRLSDLKVQSSSYGNTIPIVYGSVRIAGNMIWSSDLIETSTVVEQGGKGGGPTQETETFSYSASFAISLCEGTIAGVPRIWADGVLVYTSAVGSDAAAMQASIQIADGVTLYPGTETQLPDPTIESYLGAGNVPGYRGEAYIVFTDFQLALYGNRIPNFTFEVVTSGATAFVALGLADVATQAGASAVNPRGALPYYGPDGGVSFVARWVNASGVGTKVIFDRYRVFGPANFAYEGAFDTGLVFIFGSDTVFPCQGVLDEPGVCVVHRSNGQNFVHYYGLDGRHHMFDIPDTLSGQFVRVTKSGEDFYITTLGASPQIHKYTGDNPAPLLSPALASADRTKDVHVVGSTVYLFVQNGTNARVERYDAETLALVSTVGPFAIPGDMGNVIGGRADSDSLFYVLGGGYVRSLTAADGIVPVGFIGTGDAASPENTTFQFAGGNMFVASYYDNAYFGAFQFTPGAVTLASVASDLSVRAGLVASEYNVAALTGNLDGYVIAHQISVRAAFEQLAPAYLFDAVESDGKIKFVMRGGASIATIPDDDLAAHEEGSEMPDLLSARRIQEIELARVLNVIYINQDADYQQGTQQAKRLIGASGESVSIELPIVLSDARAKNTVDALLYSDWLGRARYGFSTSYKWKHLEPTDIVTVRGLNMRLVSTEEGAGVIKFQATSEDGLVYTQTAPGGAAGSTDQTLGIAGPTGLHLLDIPILRDVDNEAGLYAEGTGFTAAWKGARLFKSSDGTSYGEAATFSDSAVTGSATTVLANFLGGNIFDELNTVTVRVAGLLFNATEAALLNGANAAMLGLELIQYKVATLNADTTYTLSGLLRGRKGTEWAMTTHTLGERFASLSAATLRRVTANASEINLARQYKAVTIGSSIAAVAAQTFTNTAVGLKPYAPVLLGGGRNAGSDIQINWQRRSRMGASWNGFTAPVGEATESYDVEIWTAGFATLKRTFAALTTPTTPYTSAQQVTDFGSNQASVAVRVFQNSAVVGRGYKLEGTV